MKYWCDFFKCDYDRGVFHEKYSPIIYNGQISCMESLKVLLKQTVIVFDTF